MLVVIDGPRARRSRGRREPSYAASPCLGDVCACARGDLAKAELHFREALVHGVDVGGWEVVEVIRFLVKRSGPTQPSRGGPRSEPS